jgi:DMSO/TMAO reductase YedYZ molybdopterin-dependent catalytic subunit
MKVLLFVCYLCFLTHYVKAQTLQVTGEVEKRLTLSAADLAAMPRTSVSANDKQGVAHSYSGVALAELFRAAGVTTGGQLRGKNLAKYLLVSCADGYQVVFSLAELDSDFTDRVVILADQMEGKPLPDGIGPFRIVVPGEKRPARNCFQVQTLSIKLATQ